MLIERVLFLVETCIFFGAFLLIFFLFAFMETGPFFCFPMFCIVVFLSLSDSFDRFSMIYPLKNVNLFFYFFPSPNLPSLRFFKKKNNTSFRPNFFSLSNHACARHPPAPHPEARAREDVAMRAHQPPGRGGGAAREHDGGVPAGGVNGISLTQFLSVHFLSDFFLDF